MSSILDFDRAHLWHPYTSMVDPLPCFEVERCQGAYIYLADGRCLIDGMCSWWSTIHGYNHPRLNEALTSQLSRMSHVMFGGLTHASAVGVAERLLRLLPSSLRSVFLADSGSIAVEVAMKMALQYWVSCGESSRNSFLTISGGYHGDTWHCMSVCDPEGGMHSIWNGRLSEQIFVPRPQTAFHNPWVEGGFDERCIRAAFAEHSSNVAALIVEPIVQGAGGMWFYHPRYLRLLRELCDEYGVLMICDEIATGFGRTGKMFACDWAGIEPDIICLGKALTGGYMTLAATVTNDRVAKGIDGAFMHGPTFMGNPLACAVACASLDLILEGGSSLLARIGEIEAILARELSVAKSWAIVSDVRVLGAIGVVELTHSVDMRTIQQAFVDRGVWIRPFGRLVYIMPSYIMSDSQLELLCRGMIEVLEELEG